MVLAAKSPCRHFGCRALLPSPGYCDAHRKENFKQQKKVVAVDYKERNRFYQRKAWKDVRALVLGSEPLCRKCKARGRMEEACVVDHIKPIEDGGEPYDLQNLQPLCKPCHAEKTRNDEAGRGG